MQGHETPIDIKAKGLIWLLPPYCWPHRQIARKLNISASVVSKWRSELVEQGLLRILVKMNAGIRTQAGRLRKKHRLLTSEQVKSPVKPFWLFIYNYEKMVSRVSG